ncbi:hypothetical protein [Lysobacter sp. CA196]|uniref:hypothetical protein n=1 Tax=Lysobacter sp. CA196 TaxID=3455606 RepID=UPI003F8CFDC4
MHELFRATKLPQLRLGWIFCAVYIGIGPHVHIARSIRLNPEGMRGRTISALSVRGQIFAIVAAPLRRKA